MSLKGTETTALSRPGSGVRNMSKGTGMSVTVRDPNRKVNGLIKVNRDEKFLTYFSTYSGQSDQLVSRLTSLYNGHLSSYWTENLDSRKPCLF